MRKFLETRTQMDTVNKQIKQDMSAHNEAYFMPFAVRNAMKVVSWAILIVFSAVSVAATWVCLRIQQGIEDGNINVGERSWAVSGGVSDYSSPLSSRQLTRSPPWAFRRSRATPRRARYTATPSPASSTPSSSPSSPCSTSSRQSA